MERGFIGLNVAVLAIGDATVIADEPAAQLVVDRLIAAGHKVVAQAVVGDLLQAIRAKFLEWIADPGVDVIVATAGTRTEHASAALAPCITRPLVGFADLFRYMTFEEIGTAAMLVDADAAQCKSTFVFVLPSSIGAVRTALDRLIIPQLDYRTKPANLVMRMPRVAHVETAEQAAAPEPWIKPSIGGVPAPARPKARAKTLPPPLPSASVVRKIEVVPALVAKETSSSKDSRPKIATISVPLPMKKPATPAPMVEELEATPPKTREFEVAELTGPIPKTPGPSVQVDQSLSQQIKLAARTRPPTGDTSGAIDVAPLRPYKPQRGSNRFIVAWIGIAIAAAAMLAAFLVLRRSDKVDDEPHEQVATRTPHVPAPLVEPPLVDPVVVTPAPPAPPAPVEPPPPPTNEIDMPLEPAPVKPPPKAPRVVPKAPVEPAEAKEPVLEPVSTENGCDEVSCALDRYKLACCAKFKPEEPAEKPDPEPDSGLPEKIDRAMIVEGVGRVKPAVIRCGEVHGSTRGTVKLAVKVSADGKVNDVTVASTPDDALGACVASAVKKATFGKTQGGGSFSYPFVF